MSNRQTEKSNQEPKKSGLLIRVTSAFTGIAIGIIILAFSHTIALPIVLALIIIRALYELYRGVLKSEVSARNKVFLLLPYTVMVILFTSLFYFIRNYDKEHGLFLLLLALCGGWFADSGAYFVGRKLGTKFIKKRLAPNISPKKTWEGFFGGVVTNMLIFPLIYFVYDTFVKDFDIGYFAVILLGVICAVFGTLGDLLYSALKRKIKIKDFGRIMPGHGGILDRFDSVITIAPVFYLCVLCIA
ncbi:MAG: phosphatidate cytidylyltransferase [Ruminococcus sp.]|jgi:phosphatidate cytidylyltransferase|nr:phosphatidate cytidylyltransferase [Ruminococcus sp.]